MFLRSILFLMMLLTQIFCAQSGMDIINTNHKERNGYFNVTPSDEKIPGCTNTINGVLSKQPIKRVADDKEKEKLLKTEMARAIIHGGQLTNDYHALQRQYVTNAKHFECLEIIQKLSNWFFEKITDPCFTSSVIGNDGLLQNSLSQLIQGNEEKNNALKKLCTYCKLQENKITQWFVETLSEHMDGFKVLFKKNLSQQKFIQDIKNGTKVDRDKIPFFDVIFALPTFREVIDNPEHLYIREILHRLFEYGTPEDKEKILEIALNNDDPRQVMAASTLLFYSSEKAIARSILTTIAKDINHPGSFDALQYLWRNGGEKDKAIARPIFRIRAQDHGNKNAVNAAITLFEGTEEDKAIARPILIAATQNQDTKIILSIAKVLFGGTEEDKAIARPILIAATQNQDAKIAFSAAKTLFGGTEADKAIARPILIAETQSQDAEMAFSAAASLYDYGSIADKLFVIPTLKRITQKPGNPYAVYAAEKLIICGEQDEDREIARQILRAAIQNPNNKYWGAVKCLWFGTDRTDKTIARINLHRIAQDPEHQHQREAIRMLRESNEPGDQELGLRLQQRYFPVTLMPQTIVRQAQYNLPAIRSAMPIPLADLSGEPINIAVEIKRLMDVISADEANPSYLSPAGITGEAGDRNTLAQIKNHVLGFVKTLAGEELAEGETSGWQMYEDNKPAMINSFKHIIKAVDKELETDVSGAMAHLGIVMNGILHCPTGQAEALESAVKALVHGKDVVSSDARELVGKYIIVSALEKAFNNAFHYLGEVHALARARMSLAPELGFNHAIAGFHERISRVADAEIPGFYNDFYAHFTPQFILAEARRNIQTPVEYEEIVNATTQEQRNRAKSIKMEKPISVSTIYQWLIDQGEQENLNTQFGISEDFTAISDKGIINLLIKMGYLNGESPALQDFIGRLA